MSLKYFHYLLCKIPKRKKILTAPYYHDAVIMQYLSVLFIDSVLFKVVRCCWEQYCYEGHSHSLDRSSSRIWKISSLTQQTWTCYFISSCWCGFKNFKNSYCIICHAIAQHRKILWQLASIEYRFNNRIIKTWNGILSFCDMREKWLWELKISHIEILTHNIRMRKILINNDKFVKNRSMDKHSETMDGLICKNVSVLL